MLVEKAIKKAESQKTEEAAQGKEGEVGTNSGLTGNS